MHLKMSSAKWRLLGLGLNELIKKSLEFHLQLPGLRAHFHLESKLFGDSSRICIQQCSSDMLPNHGVSLTRSTIQGWLPTSPDQPHGLCVLIHLLHTKWPWPSFRRRYFQMHLLWMKSFVIWDAFVVNEKFCILIKISLKFVLKGPIDNKPALVQIMAWHRIGIKPLFERMLNWFTNAYMQH